MFLLQKGIYKKEMILKLKQKVKKMKGSKLY